MIDDSQDLAGKTALLSLSALIETARDGDAGKPYANAAEALFRLVQQSAATASDRSRADERSVVAAEDLDSYRLAIHRELGKISAIAEALGTQSAASVHSLRAASDAFDAEFCDRRLARDLLALADLIKCKKSGIDAALASDTIELDAKINALRWATEKRTTGSDLAACPDAVDRNEYEMF